MDVREKLVELLCKVQDYGTKNTCGEWSVTVERKDNETVADHLIAGGVTVQDSKRVEIDPFNGWVSVKDRLPDTDQDVILYTREIETYGKHHEKKKIYRNIYMGYFDGEEWLTSYCHGCEYIFRMNEKYPNETIEVTHWMPIPKPPKGE